MHYLLYNIQGRHDLIFLMCDEDSAFETSFVSCYFLWLKAIKKLHFESQKI